MRPRRLVSLLVAGCMMVSMMPVSAVTAFAEEAAPVSASEGETTVASIGADNYASIEAAIAAAKNGDTITLTDNVTIEDTLIIEKTLTLDLNGKTLSNTKEIWSDTTGHWSLISVRGNGDLTITGNGKLDSMEGDCFAVDVYDKDAKLTIEDGTFVGNISAIYVYDGTAIIKGGDFTISQTDDDVPYGFMLNCLDGNREAETAKIIVSGGTYYQFDPADNVAEGKHTDFCADGYTTSKDGDNYTVRKYDVSAEVEVDKNQSGDSKQNEIGEEITVAVKAKGPDEDLAKIKKLSLEFGDENSDLDKVSSVRIKKDGKYYSLDKYKPNYQNIPLAELFETPVEETESSAEENGIALFDADSQSDDLTSFDLLVTYNENGVHKVTAVFQKENGKKVSSDDTTVYIGTKPADDAPVAEGDDDGGSLAVVVGAAVGVGVVALAYHAGVRIFADQVLGSGVPVPRTQEAVALKAWELAGKPAVAVEGEPLSETAQAERWVVERGLMQNEADGSFNGQKRMGSLTALVTLDAAKKLA